MRSIHQDEKVREEHLLDLDEIARAGAKRMLAEALEAEVEAYVESARDQRDERGRSLVVRRMATPGSGRFSVEPGLWRSVLRESMIAGWTRAASDDASRA
jgi:hypothetical protein